MLMSLGAACIVAAAVGTGGKLFGWPLPLIGSIKRQVVLGLIGVLFFSVGLWEQHRDGEDMPVAARAINLSGDWWGQDELFRLSQVGTRVMVRSHKSPQGDSGSFRDGVLSWNTHRRDDDRALSCEGTLSDDRQVIDGICTGDGISYDFRLTRSR